jgi:hypothetical protein
MDKLFYRDYTITPGAIRDERTGKHLPTIHMAWHEANGKQGSRSFTLEERCPTFNDAIAVAVEQAKAWAERWLTPLGQSDRAQNLSEATEYYTMPQVKETAKYREIAPRMNAEIWKMMRKH